MEMNTKRKTIHKKQSICVLCGMKGKPNLCQSISPERKDEQKKEPSPKNEKKWTGGEWQCHQRLETFTTYNNIQLQAIENGIFEKCVCK